MNLPHGEYLIFAKEVLFQSCHHVQVRCEFNTLPTLAMFIEAAAQSSSAFHTESDKNVKNAFITMVKDVTLLNDIKKKSYVIHVEIQIEINDIKHFYFSVEEDCSGIKCASGNVTLLIPE